MVFSANPLSLSVPDPAFESWLRDTGYLEVLDSRSSSSSTTDTCPPSTSTSKPPNPNSTLPKPPNPKTILSSLKTLISLLTLNPFAKLTTDDFAGPTPSWTLSFIARLDSYSCPAGPAQARMRAQENVRRYARNYAFLSLLFLACSLSVSDAGAAAGGGGQFVDVGGGEVLQREVGDGGEVPRIAAGLGSRRADCYCGYTLLMQPPDSLLLCCQRQLHSDDLACFLPEPGSSEAICRAKSPQNITAKVNLSGYQVTAAIIFEAGDGSGSWCYSRSLDGSALLFCWHERSQAPDSLFAKEG